MRFSWLGLVALVVAVGLLFAVHLYLYRRLVRDVVVSAWLRRAGVVALALPAAGFVLVRWLMGVPHTHVVSVALMSWAGVVLYLLLALLAADAALWAWGRAQRARRGAGPEPMPKALGADAAPAVDHSRRLFVSRSLAGGALLASGSASALGVYSAFSAPQVSHVELRLPHLPRALDGFTLVQLSDLHVGAIIRRPFVEELVLLANAQKPDLVAITGDLVDGSVAVLGPHVAALSALRSRYGTFFVTGNHDYYSGADAWCQAVEGLGISVLRNRHVTIGDEGGSFELAGVDDWGNPRALRREYDLDAALAGIAPERPTVLLAHQPSNFDEVARRGVGLQLSGHTHGGQLFPSTVVARVVWGERVAGLSKVGESSLFVSRGCGFVGPPMRLGAPPEVVRITLLAR